MSDIYKLNIAIDRISTMNTSNQSKKATLLSSIILLLPIHFDFSCILRSYDLL